MYRDIVTQTGGEHADMCTESAQAAFERFARSIVDRVVPCNFGLRDPGQGRTLDPTKINVQLRTPGAQHTIPNVVSVEDCDGLIEGWYYDNDSTPVEIRLCPASCTLVRQTRDAEIDVLVGCPTIPRPGCN